MLEIEQNFKRRSSLLKQATQKDLLVRALRVSILVGIILNIVNNPVLFNNSLDGINIYKVLLTFIVPFCVSLYSSVISNKKCA